MNDSNHVTDPISIHEAIRTAHHFFNAHEDNISKAKTAVISRIDHSSLLYSLYKRSILAESCKDVKILKRKFNIRFSELDTPRNEAVLAFDRSGSYLVSLGDDRNDTHERDHGNDSSVSLTISFYATPSRHRLEKSLKNPCIRALSIPLASDGEYLSCTQTPVKILISADSDIGVAIYKQTYMKDNSDTSILQESDECIGSIVLFIPPKHCTSENNLGVYTRYSNVSLTALMNSHTIRNLLWKTTFVPYRVGERCSSQESNKLTLHVRKSSSAYVLFLDEEDNFLIHWIDFNSATHDNETYIINEHPKEQASLKKIFCHDDPYNVYDESFQTSHMMNRPMIVHRAILNIGIILDDIISNRPALFGKETVHFKYAYTLISFHSDGRTVDMVLSFTNPNFIKDDKTKTQAFAVIASIDIFNQSYNEIKWFLHSNCTDTKGLQSWSNKIALHKRMLDMNIGPYSYAPNRSKKAFNQIKVSTHEENVFDPRDWDMELWKNRISTTSYTPIKVAMASLYNNCDVYTNDAILNRSPVREISARDVPIHISYS
jgi:hypothetical protein